jgi:hypothetical protein
MAFKKVGSPLRVDRVYCSCGGEISKETQKCKKCQKDYSSVPQEPTQIPNNN